MTNPRKTRRPEVLILTSEVLFPQFFPEPLLERLGRFAHWRLCTEGQDTPRLREHIARSDALVTTWHSPFLKPDMLGTPPRVRLIAHCGGELRARMQDTILELVTVTNSPEPMAEPVAEMALAMALSLVRRLPEYHEAMRGGQVQDNRRAPEGETLRGRTVGLVGLGRIGRAFARLIRPFGVHLLVSDPYCDPSAVRRAGGSPCELDELLSRSSVVVLAAALTAETRGLLDSRRLGLLPAGACLVNVGRGGLIVLDALTAALKTGRIRAALDVTDPLEPLPAGHELRALPGLFLTPHVASAGLEVRRAMGETAVEEVIRFFRGRSVRNRVAPEMLARMT